MMRNNFFLLSMILMIVIAPHLNARIINVPGDSTTIQGGIDGSVDGDTVMVALGTYHEYEIDFLGKAITVMSTDPEDSAVVANTIVDAYSMGRVFHFHSSEHSSSVLTGLTITGGLAEFGGGIYCFWQSSPTIMNNIIRGNQAEENGGGIDCHFSSPTISNNTITGNSADRNGGGLNFNNDSHGTISGNRL
jgi:parallel beta-helix repeat protein